ncbi:MAG TPA: helix-turn-helix transcriptional regulator [Actinomycetota bacterium]
MGKHVTRNLGRALRRAREARGFSLRDASRSSGGRFTPSGIAGYERGERRISVERLCALADLYGVRPDRLLADALRAPGALGIDLDLSAVAELSPEVRHLIAGFIEEVLAMRGESGADRISLRSGDLEIIAGTSGSSAIELLRRIREAIADDARQPPR